MSNKHICIVDDDMDDIFLMSASLRRLEAASAMTLTISTFTDPQDALNFFAGSAGAPGSLPDCVCMDINMPGLDGIELLKRLREMDHLTSLPIYIVSTTIDKTTHHKAISLGATGSFVKPESMAAMQIMQKEFLGISEVE
ncbi:response regulator [Hoeflea sp.]|uniref:response regulator n=1 Tax=Hoeflea sp. TaxID=1940281 RepID=UPI00199AF02A|nr:response regulator [Hoeflea sp.]MBC7283768.1 response regulator [Hoeflea sp.]